MQRSALGEIVNGGLFWMVQRAECQHQLTEGFINGGFEQSSETYTTARIAVPMCRQCPQGGCGGYETVNRLLLESAFLKKL